MCSEVFGVDLSEVISESRKAVGEILENKERLEIEHNYSIYDLPLMRNIIISPLGTSPERDKEIKEIYKNAN